MSFMGSPEWGKLLSMPFLALKEACMIELHRASIATKTAFKVFPCTENPVIELHKTSMMVKTALLISLDAEL